MSKVKANMSQQDSHNLCDSVRPETMLGYVNTTAENNLGRARGLLCRVRDLIQRLDTSRGVAVSSAESNKQEDIGLLQKMARDQEFLVNVLEDLRSEIIELENLL